MTPRLWTPLPALHHRHAKMVALLERHGASGPHAFTVLLSEAAAMVHGKESRGVVEMPWSEFARFAGIDPEDARERLRELSDDPFRLVEIEADTALGFRLSIVRWAEWDKMPKDPGGAERQRRYRESKADNDAGNVVSLARQTGPA